MNPEADEKKLKKQGVVQGGVCSRILVNVHVMHVGAELGAPLAIWMVQIDGAHSLRRSFQLIWGGQRVQRGPWSKKMKAIIDTPL